MAGPILDAIRQFRSNRQERVAARREKVGDYLGSDRRIPKLLRSLGAGSSRQDLVWARKDVSKPAERKMQDDPAGPDTGKFANQRAYDGDAQGVTPVSTKVVPVVPEDETETIKAPAPVQGGTQNLPAPPQAKAPEAPKKRKGPPPRPHDDAIEQRILAMERDSEDPQHPPEFRQRLRQDAILARAAQNRAHGDWSLEYPDTVEGQLESVRTLGEASPSEAALLFPTTAFAKNPDGSPAYGGRVPGELIHRDAFVQQALPTFQQYGGFAELPDDQKFMFLAKAAAAFPPMEFYGADGKTLDPSKQWSQSKSALHRIYTDLKNSVNPTGNADLDRFLRNVAYGVVRNNGGQFTENDSAYIKDFLTGGPIKRNPPYFFWDYPAPAPQSAMPTKAQIFSGE